MPEIQVKDKLITLEELGTAINAKAGVTSVNSQTGAVSVTPANIGAVAKTGDTMTGELNVQHNIVSYDLELKPPVGSGNGGFIDFTYNGANIDNTSRIIEDQWGVLNINGIPFDKVNPFIGVPYGGTGATTSAGARANLQITPANIRAVAVGADTSDATIQQEPSLNLAVQIWSHGNLGRYVFSIAKDGCLYLYDEDLGRDIWKLHIITETIQLTFPANQNYVYVSYKSGYNLVQAITMQNESNTYISGIVDNHSVGLWILFVSNPPASTATYAMKLCWVKE